MSLLIILLFVISHLHLRQAMLDNIGVLVATVIMVLTALTIVTLKVSWDINIFNKGSIKFTEADWKVIMHNGSDQRRKIVNPSLEFLETFDRYSQGFTGNGVAIINGSNSHNKWGGKENLNWFSGRNVQEGGEHHLRTAAAAMEQHAWGHRTRVYPV